jgi:hypothetical protein
MFVHTIHVMSSHRPTRSQCKNMESVVVKLQHLQHVAQDVFVEMNSVKTASYICTRGPRVTFVTLQNLTCCAYD